MLRIHRLCTQEQNKLGAIQLHTTTLDTGRCSHTFCSFSSFFSFRHEVKLFPALGFQWFHIRSEHHATEASPRQSTIPPRRCERKHRKSARGLPKRSTPRRQLAPKTKKERAQSDFENEECRKTFGDSEAFMHRKSHRERNNHCPYQQIPETS